MFNNLKLKIDKLMRVIKTIKGYNYNYKTKYHCRMISNKWRKVNKYK